MWSLSAIASRLRLLITRQLARLGFREDSFLLLLALVVGIITAAAAVAFHSLIVYTRDLLYVRLGEHAHLFRHPGVWLLVLLPAAGSLAVDLISHYVLHALDWF